MVLAKIFWLLIILLPFSIVSGGDVRRFRSQNAATLIVKKNGRFLAAASSHPTSAVLPEREVDAMNDVLSKLGFVGSYKFTQSSCQSGPNSIYGSFYKCDCSYDANATCHITELGSASANFSGGSIHQNIYYLEVLEILDLSGCKLVGSIPGSLGSLLRLQWLDLSGNQLTGSIPPSLGTLSSLAYLDLSRNQLTGSIPPSLGNLSSLEYLWLSSNLLSGEIPRELGNLSKLRNMILQMNKLDGKIPAELGKLTNLEDLWLSSNLLSGEIPRELGNLSKLRNMILQMNKLDGKIPVELGKLTNLEDLWLSSNLLSGEIPRELGNLSKLQNMMLQMNSLDGKIPAELGKLTNLEDLRLGENNLTGKLPPELGKLKKLSFFDVVSNKLGGELPLSFENLTSLLVFAVAGNNLKGNIRDFIPKQWTQLGALYLNGNEFEGKLPPELFNMSTLVYLYVSDLNNPGFPFPTIAKEAQMGTSINKLILRNCSITGPIPDYIAYWESLEYLDLSFNKLTGPIPDSFKNMSLYEMYLTGNNLTGKAQSWISKIVQTKLDLSYNNFLNSVQEKKNGSKEFNIEPNWDSIRKRKGMESCRGTTDDSIFINCGGPSVTFGGNPYQKDDSKLDYYVEQKRNWMYTCSGGWAWAAQGNSSDYIKNMTCGASENSIYATSRHCPVALTYYVFCLPKGEYHVELHFAETVFTKHEDYSSNGRRVFDIYIQGEKKWKDFDIKAESRAPNQGWQKNTSAIVQDNDNSLVIHLFWPGKGSQYNPPALNGPLLSAISITPKEKPRKKLSSSQIAGIAVGSVLTPLLVLAFLWQIGFFRDRDLDETNVEVVHGKCVTLRQIIAGTKKFHQTMKIGEGRFGEVYKSELKDEGITLEVTKISSRLEKKQKDEIQTEILNLTSLRHENLVRLLHRHSRKGLHLLIYEYLEKGSLQQALFESETKPSWKERMEICLGIAKGLKYLHEENNLKPVHGNLRSKNIMLDENLTAKLSEFGLAMIYHDEPFMTLEPKEDLVRMAPECAFKPMTTASDVYSFGHVVLEIVSGKPSLERKQDRNEYLVHTACSLHEKGMILDLVDEDLIRLMSSDDKDQAKNVLELAMACLSISPENRPKLSDIVSELGRITGKE